MLCLVSLTIEAQLQRDLLPGIFGKGPIFKVGIALIVKGRALGEGAYQIHVELAHCPHHRFVCHCKLASE